MITIQLKTESYTDLLDGLQIAHSVLNEGAELFKKHEKLERRDRFKKLIDEIDISKEDVKIKDKG